jgi:hypothetical protein
MEVKQIEGAKAPSFEGLLFYVPVPVPVTGRAAAQARIAMGPTRPDPTRTPPENTACGSMAVHVNLDPRAWCLYHKQRKDNGKESLRQVAVTVEPLCDL